MKKNSFKTNRFYNLRQALTLLILVLAGALASCEILPEPKDEPIGRCFTPDILPCGTYVTAELITCGSGEFGNIWLKMDDGSYLQPYENNTGITSIQVGQRYRIGFDKLGNVPQPHGNGMVCLAMVPPSTPIRLQCLTEVEPAGACNTFVTATSVNCSVGAFDGIWLKLDNGQYLQPWINNSGTAQLVEGQRYKVGYEAVAKDSRYDNQIVCAALPTDSLAWHPKVVSITCLETVQTGTN